MGESFEIRSADVLIVGSGVAGLSAALEFARIAPDLRVTLLTRDEVGGHGASPLAQGGIAAALGPSDSPSIHAKDTRLAGNGLGRTDLIDILTTDGPGRIHDLMKLGARFDLDGSGAVSLGLEGAHSMRRIVHADGDRTGAEVTRTLAQAVGQTRSVHIAARMQVLQLLNLDGQVRGLWAREAGGALHFFRAQAIILATGGPGRVYLRTTAPPGLEGDGLAMAARAGARLRDLEFIQFHPTALNVDADPLPLVTEALRGAGALLVNRDGERVLRGQRDDELASRDRVARAVRLKIREGEEVFLDARDVFGPRAEHRFPGVHRLCRMHGIEPVQDLIPVTPAAHYHMGGVAVDEAGRASLHGLWAIGEAAGSGVHGANRLASNSLLEGLVFGPRAARSIADAPGPSLELSYAERREAARIGRQMDRKARLSDELALRIRTLLWDLVGVVRNKAGLTEAIDQLDAIDAELPPGVPGSGSNLLLSARMITRAALFRRGSIGSHYRSDAPDSTSDPLRHSVVTLSPRDFHRIHVEFEGRSDPARSVHPTPARPAGRRESTAAITLR